MGSGGWISRTKQIMDFCCFVALAGPAKPRCGWNERFQLDAIKMFQLDCNHSETSRGGEVKREEAVEGETGLQSAAHQ